MGLKKTLKNLAGICFNCHCTFVSYDEKHIHRIDKTKGYKTNNMVVMCEGCKLGLMKLKIELWQLFFLNKYLDEYFKYIPICSRVVVVKKMRKLKRDYEKKLKEMEKYKYDE